MWGAGVMLWCDPPRGAVQLSLPPSTSTLRVSADTVIPSSWGSSWWQAAPCLQGGGQTGHRATSWDVGLMPKCRSSPKDECVFAGLCVHTHGMHV